MAAKKIPTSIYYMDTYSTSGVFSLDKINGNMQREVVALLLLIAWPNGTLWMVDKYAACSMLARM
jgi:hypothetical protein